MKTQLRDIRSELTVLDRTEKILKNRHEEQQRLIRKIESEHGVLGYTDAKSEIEHISAKSQSVNVEKGATLDEITKVVEELDARLK